MANKSYRKTSLPTEKTDEEVDSDDSAKSLYEQLESNRLVFLERARDSAKLTIPTLVPPAGYGPHTKYDTPYQSIGSRGVNNLSSKLLLALLPPNAPFFRLAVDPFELQKSANDKENVEALKTELEKALSKIERLVMQEVETSALRVGTYEALRSLIVSGNALVYLPEEGGMRVFRLDSYVVKRDPSGNVTHIVVKEKVSPLALPENAKELITGDTESAENDSVEVYTKIERDEEDGSFEIYQEINGEEVPESRGVYTENKLPWIALRFIRVDGEDYGRGFVEEYIGDLRSLEALSKAAVESTAASSKVVFMVDPTGTTRIKTLAEAENGAFISGKSTDVTALQADKRADLQVVNTLIEQISVRLSFAFLLNSAVQRQAERVTAEEIRFMAQELETTLGGAYSILSQEFQLPLVQMVIDRMNKQRRLPKLSNKLVKPMIVTGVEALGRGNDLTKLDQFIAGMTQALGPAALQYINISEYLARRAASLGIDSENLIKTQEDIAAEQQQAQQMQFMNQMGPDALKAAAQVATATPENATAAAQALTGGNLDIQNFTPPSAMPRQGASQ